MRAFVSGQIGVDKGPYLNAVQQIAKQNGIDLVVCHLGQMMYHEAPDVPRGRILNLPITRLNTLRRAVFKDREIFCRQIVNRAVSFVGDRDVERDQVDAYTDRFVLCFSG